jgi:EmrB/QacA subfamily drug resistance transporter
MGARGLLVLEAVEPTPSPNSERSQTLRWNVFTAEHLCPCPNFKIDLCKKIGIFESHLTSGDQLEPRQVFFCAGWGQLLQMNDNKMRNNILLVLFFGVLMGALDIAVVGPALPAVAKDFGVDVRGQAWVIGIYVLLNLIGTPLMAKLSDALGRRAIYVLDLALFAAGSLIVAVSPFYWFLLAGRAVQGLGAGGIFPVASAVIGDTFPAEKRGRALGLMGAVFGVAFLIGPLVAGVILFLSSWRWLFIVNLPISLALIVAGLRVLPSARPARRRGFDALGMIVLGILLAALAFGISQVNTADLASSFSSLNVWPFLLTAIVLAPVFVLVERGARDPVVRVSLFGSRQVVLASLLSAGAGLGEATIVFVPTLVVAAFGVTTYQASFMLLPAVLAMAVGAPLSGRILDARGSKVVVLAGTLLIAIGLVTVSLLPTNLAAFFSAAVLVGLGLSSLLGATLRFIMLNEAPVTERAAAQGIISLEAGLGQLIGAALVGAIAASRGGGVGGFSAAFLVVGVVYWLLVLTGLGLKGRAAELETMRQNEAARPPARAEAVPASR